jgi:flagellar biosynthetic protein FliR
MATDFTYESFLIWWGSFFWPFVRIGALMAIFPVLSSRAVPMRVKLIVTIVMTIAVMPSIQLTSPIDPFTQEGIMMMATQAGIGLAMGLVFVIVFQSFTLAGQMIANAMGLGFAAMVDPGTGVNSPVVSQIFTILVSLLFVVMNGHLLLIRMLADSFVAMPLTGGFLTLTSVHAVALLGSQLFIWAMMVALPVLTALLLVNIALGVISRAAPTLNIFSIGFVITILGGLGLIWWLLPLLGEQFTLFMHQALTFVQTLRLNETSS